jgi:hypothetical protein
MKTLLINGPGGVDPSWASAEMRGLEAPGT